MGEALEEALTMIVRPGRRPLPADAPHICFDLMPVQIIHQLQPIFIVHGNDFADFLLYEISGRHLRI